MLPTKFADPFDTFIAPARLKPQLWRFILGMFIIAVTFLAVTIGLALAMTVLDPAGLPYDDLVTGRTPYAIVAIFLGIGGATLGVWAAVKLLHARSLMSVIGPKKHALRNFCISAAVITILQLLWLIVWSILYDATPNIAALTTLLFLPLAIIIVLIQTSAEEFVCRGYMMQHLAARFQSPLIWFILPQIVFAALHYDPETMGTNVWPIVTVVFAYGLMWADLTRITGNLGAACGWHFANNLFIMTIIGTKGQLDAIVYQVTPYTAITAPTALIFVDLLIGLITWGILRRILRP